MNFLCFSLLVKIILDTVCYCNVFIFFYLMCGLKKHVKKLEIKKKNCNTGKEFVSTPTLIKYNYKKNHHKWRSIKITFILFFVQ